MGCINTKPHKNSKRHQSQIVPAVSPNAFISKSSSKFEDIYILDKDNLRSTGFNETRDYFQQETKLPRVVKFFEKRDFPTKKTLQSILKEIEIMKRLNHPSIGRIIEHFEDSKKICIVMEKCKGGVLGEEIITLRSFPEKASANIMIELLSAVKYLHESQIFHGNISPENIFLVEKGSLSGIKLFDFSSASYFSSESLPVSSDSVFSQAPEVIIGNYDHRCDLWSCGVVAYMMICGSPPFDDESVPELKERILLGNVDFSSNIWSSCSQECIDFINKLLCPANTRMNASEALNHPWLGLYKTHSVSEERLYPILAALRNFNSQNNIKKNVCSFIASQYLTVEETKKNTEIFLYIDRDLDGKIGKGDFMAFYKELMKTEIDEDEAKDIIKTLDSNQSGYIEYSQFLAACVDTNTLANAHYLKSAFKRFDKKYKGKITFQEIMQALEYDDESKKVILRKLQDELNIEQHEEIDFKSFKTICKVRSG